MKFSKNIREIQDNSEFFDIDYEDVLQNFDTDDIEEKVRLNLQVSLVNVAFLDAIRGPISRPKFIDRILSIYRKEWIEDIRYRVEETNKKENIQ